MKAKCLYGALCKCSQAHETESLGSTWFWMHVAEKHHSINQFNVQIIHNTDIMISIIHFLSNSAFYSRKKGKARAKISLPSTISAQKQEKKETNTRDTHAYTNQTTNTTSTVQTKPIQTNISSSHSSQTIFLLFSPFSSSFFLFFTLPFYFTYSLLKQITYSFLAVLWMHIHPCLSFLL